MKKVLAIFAIIVMFSLVFNTVSVFAFGDGFNQSNISQNNSNSNIDALKNPVKRLANTIFLILQIASVAGVLVVGVKYMYTSAEQKAEYKKGLVMVVIGLVLVFGASTVASFVVSSFEDAIDVNKEIKNSIYYENVTKV